MTTSNSLYEHEVKDKKKKEEERKGQIQRYVRNKLFPSWKFFTNKKQIAFSDKPGSIIVKICTDLKIEPRGMHRWWDKNKKLVVQSLNQRETT